MLQYGIVSEYDEKTGKAKVKLDGDNIVTDFLPIIVRSAKGTKESTPLEINDHVACIIDSFGDSGVILGAIYDEDEKPVSQSKNIHEIVFKTGDYIRYNMTTSKYEIKIGTCEMNITPAGFAFNKASEGLKSILVDLVTGLIAETHGTAVGPTSPPINAATYVSILARLNVFFLP